MFFRKRIIKKYKEKLTKIKLRNKQRLTDLKKEFSKIFHHDIKTVLLAQQNFIELILKGSFGEISPFQKEVINEILLSNRFLGEIINNAIFLADIEEKTSFLDYENVDIINQTTACLKDIQDFAKDKNQTLIFKHLKNQINLAADKKLVEKIIYNLLSGCISYGFEKSDIVISIEENEKEILFNAKNKSIYMTKEKLDEIFENNKNNDFNQLGMKLNLNIAKKLINMHNWDFIVQSNKSDNSSTFGFVVKK